MIEITEKRLLHDWDFADHIELFEMGMCKIFVRGNYFIVRDPNNNLSLWQCTFPIGLMPEDIKKEIFGDQYNNPEGGLGISQSRMEIFKDGRFVRETEHKIKLARKEWEYPLFVRKKNDDSLIYAIASVSDDSFRGVRVKRQGEFTYVSDGYYKDEFRPAKRANEAIKEHIKR